MKQLTLFATFEEAEASIAATKACQDKQLPCLYEWEKGFLMITGIGSFAALVATSPFASQIDTICHLGLAGALDNTLEAGKVYRVASCSKFLWHPKGLDAAKQSMASFLCPNIAIAESGLHLVSSDWPIYRQSEKELLATHFDMVDMEGYAAAFLAQTHHKQCVIYKVISDFCTDDTPLMIKRHLQKASKLLSDTLLIQPLVLPAPAQAGTEKG